MDVKIARNTHFMYFWNKIIKLQEAIPGQKADICLTEVPLYSAGIFQLFKPYLVVVFFKVFTC